MSATPTTHERLVTVTVKRVTGDHISAVRNAPGPRYVYCVKKGCTWAELRTVLEKDNIMKPGDVFVVGPGLLSTPSYERNEAYDGYWALWEPNVILSPSSQRC